MAITSEFLAAINQICAERGIDKNNVMSALQLGLASAYKKEIGKDELDNIRVEIDSESGVFRLISVKTVVKKVEDTDREISLKEAHGINKKVEIGDTVEIQVPYSDFGRIAAQTAKQVITQEIGAFEREAILNEYKGKIGQVLTGMMQRMQKGNVVLEVGKATAIMAPQDQIASEFYKMGQKYKALLLNIEDTEAGKYLVVSRSDPKFLIELFKFEVPEIESGVVEVKACAREAGSRSKMAVVSHQEGVDPIGSCVGQRGVRIANVMNELNEEKIDIIEWDPELEKFIANSLSPAKVLSVKITNDGEGSKLAVVKVDDDQLSLAIGREGQNVRLAYKLTGYRIDIRGSKAEEEAKKAEASEKKSAKTKKAAAKKSTKKSVAKKTTEKKVAKKAVKTTVKKSTKKATVKKTTAKKSVRKVATKKITKKALKKTSSVKH